MFKLTLFMLSLPIGQQFFKVGVTIDPTPLHHCLIAFLITIFIGPRVAIAFYLGIEWRDGWISP